METCIILLIRNILSFLLLCLILPCLSGSALLFVKPSEYYLGVVFNNVSSLLCHVSCPEFYCLYKLPKPVSCPYRTYLLAAVCIMRLIVCAGFPHSLTPSAEWTLIP